MERLQIVALVGAALQRYRQHFPQLLRVIALPALAHAVVLYIWVQTTDQDKWLAVLLLVAQAFLWTLAAISCHRIILLGSEFVPRLGATGTAARDWRFIVTAAALYVVLLLIQQFFMFGVFIPFSFIKVDPIALAGGDLQNLVYLARLPALYVVSRLALCLPAAAIDRPLSPRRAWSMTQGNGLRLLVLLGLLPWLLQLARYQLAWLFPSPTDAVVIGNLLFWVLLPFEVAVLSLCYQRSSQRPA